MQKLLQSCVFPVKETQVFLGGVRVKPFSVANSPSLA